VAPHSHDTGQAVFEVNLLIALFVRALVVVWGMVGYLHLLKTGYEPSFVGGLLAGTITVQLVDELNVGQLTDDVVFFFLLGFQLLVNSLFGSGRPFRIDGWVHLQKLRPVELQA